CDLVFAKKSLLKYCEKERITFLPYNTFDDVIAKLSAILMKKHLKKRYQAELKRREIYIAE
ncbi:MAG: 2-hydroxy-3-keto-5-methylthiopentenyl-1-phosphate phosphatase, partial [Ignavibacteriaceae bacterium]|nr:2-hydroxy-3-keto-5-methylthiopentenyl-1-phosphate phosphatase [Ignavibacteriaceae bacterium]